MPNTERQEVFSISLLDTEGMPVDLPLFREYLRVLFDSSGRELSNDEQHTDNEVAVATLGLRLGEPYATSARHHVTPAASATSSCN